MKNNFLLRTVAGVCTMFYTQQFYAQVGINTITPDANAVLDIVSTTKGVLIPRLNQTQVNTLAALIPADGTLVYNSTSQCVQIFRRTVPSAGSFDCLVVTNAADTTKDAWIDDPANNQIILSTKSDGTTPRDAQTDFVILDEGNVGIGTASPQNNLHINGTLQLTNELNVGGTATADGSSGTANQVLVSGGAGAAPLWATMVNYGDLKQSLKSADHNGWILLDGRAVTSLTPAQKTQAENLGFPANLPNATGAYLVQNGTTLGSVTGDNFRTLAQNQLPNISLSYSGTTTSNGEHTHTYQDKASSSYSVQMASTAPTPVADDVTNTYYTSSAGEHTHNYSGSTSSLNGDVTQVQIDIKPKSLSTNTFVYLGA